MHRQTVQLEPLLLNNQHMNQSKNNVPSINQKPIHIAPVPFLIGMFGFSIWLVSLFQELSLFAVYLPPCHSARSRRRSRRIHHQKKTSSSERGWTFADGGWGLKSTFLYPSSALAGTFSPGRRLFFAKRDNGSCNSGQALRAEWHVGEVIVEEESSSIRCVAKTMCS